MNTPQFIVIFVMLSYIAYHVNTATATAPPPHTIAPPESVCYVNYAVSPVETHQWEGKNHALTP